jgi:hypothetical protein
VILEQYPILDVSITYISSAEYRGSKKGKFVSGCSRGLAVEEFAVVVLIALKVKDIPIDHFSTPHQKAKG